MNKLIQLEPMATAPKDGTRIIIVWYDEGMDTLKYNIRMARWWKPTRLEQWEAGARPHWEYINDNNFCMEIHKPNGWLPKLELLEDEKTNN